MVPSGSSAETRRAYRARTGQPAREDDQLRGLNLNNTSKNEKDDKNSALAWRRVPCCEMEKQRFLRGRARTHARTQPHAATGVLFIDRAFLPPLPNIRVAGTQGNNSAHAGDQRAKAVQPNRQTKQERSEGGGGGAHKTHANTFLAASKAAPTGVARGVRAPASSL